MDTLALGPQDEKFWKAHKEIRNFSVSLLKNMNQGVCPMRTEKTPVSGILLERIASMGNEHKEGSKKGKAVSVDTTNTLAFAGHDTTGNTMSWFLFEICKNPKVQDRLRAEIFAEMRRLHKKNPSELEYRDFLAPNFPYLERCINETLRLWPVIANGTFRELIRDDYVTGLNGKKVRVPKGTILQAPHFLIHRDKRLWGNDAEEFNPDREWNEEYFLPFTLAPRDCLGKNFAQIEMRVVLIGLLTNFQFKFAEPTATTNLDYAFFSDNPGVLRPRHGIYVHAQPLIPTSIPKSRL